MISWFFGVACAAGYTFWRGYVFGKQKSLRYLPESLDNYTLHDCSILFESVESFVRRVSDIVFALDGKYLIKIQLSVPGKWYKFSLPSYYDFTVCGNSSDCMLSILNHIQVFKSLVGFDILVSEIPLNITVYIYKNSFITKKLKK